MLYVLSLFGVPLLVTVVLAVVATVFTNALIDGVGHARGGAVPRRTWASHSIVTAPLWGAAAWALVLVVPSAFVGVFPPDLLMLWFFTSLGVIAGWSHLLLDWITEGAVFAFDGKRRALAHFSYHNRLLNLWFSALGIALLLVAIL